MHRIIKSYSKVNQNSSLNHIDVPIVAPADWSKIPKKIPNEHLTRIDNINEMKKISSLATNIISNHLVVLHSPSNLSKLF